MEGLIKEINIQLTNTVDNKNKELKNSLLSNVNNTLKKFQSFLLFSVNTMIYTQIEAINKNMITTINKTMNNYPGIQQQSLNFNSPQQKTQTVFKTTVIS